MSTKDKFYEHFHMAPQWTGSAPGRVNLIGEHTDYNGGFVLPTVIPQTTDILLAPRDDQEVHVVTENMTKDALFTFTLGEENPRHQWSDYIQGSTKLWRAAGQPLSGFNAYIKSSIPMGAGVSSSAALLVAMFRALNHSAKNPLSAVDMALLSQRVENEFVGAHVGIMDQMAVSLASQGQALFLDTRNLNYRQISLPKDRVDLFVINSGVHHGHTTSGYNTRRSECEAACEQLGINQLRDLDVKDLAELDVLSNTLRRRARHVITENARVLAAVEALEKEDFPRLGKLFLESHQSMREDYEISVKEIDTLVELAMRDPRVFGARMTGGGFGGSIVGITQPGAAKSVASKIADSYNKTGHHKATILVS